MASVTKQHEMNSPQPYLAYVCDRLAAAIDRVNQVRYDLTEHADRLHGDAPSEIAASTEQLDKGPGICGEIEWRIEALSEALFRLEGAASRNTNLA